jgi:hypothetical protein
MIEFSPPYWQAALGYAFAYFLAGYVGHKQIGMLMWRWRKSISNTHDEGLAVIAGIVGRCEAVIYVTAFLSGFNELAIGWLVMKALTYRMAEDNRREFHVYIAGNACSLISSMAASFLGCVAFTGLRALAH